MKAEGSSKALVFLYGTTRRHMPEDKILSLEDMKVAVSSETHWYLRTKERDATLPKDDNP
jgi:hypothetical protein